MFLGNFMAKIQKWFPSPQINITEKSKCREEAWDPFSSSVALSFKSRDWSTQETLKTTDYPLCKKPLREDAEKGHRVDTVLYPSSETNMV